MKVTFSYTNGKQRDMHETHARILSKLNRGTYLTRDMQAQAVPVQTVIQAPEETPEPVSAIDDGLDELDSEQLHEIARERGVHVHHRAGADRVRAALREAE